MGLSYDTGGWRTTRFRVVHGNAADFRQFVQAAPTYKPEPPSASRTACRMNERLHEPHRATRECQEIGKTMIGKTQADRTACIRSFIA